MFAPLVATAHAKAPADASHSLGRQVPRPAAHRSRHGVNDQAVAQGHVRDGGDPGLATESTRSALWDFGKIPILSPLPAGPVIQPKLTIGAVDDPLEREADAAAEQVMRMPDPALSISAALPRVTRKCAACEEEDKKLQMKPLAAPNAPDVDAPPIVHDVLRQPGEPLDAATRAFFQPRLGSDLSAVRVHRDSKAAQSARAIGARAYTLGNNIVFGSGQWMPGTDRGDRLMAHELAHTLQNDGTTAGRTSHLPLINRRTEGEAAHLLMRQPFPGAGMAPPGDCSWGRYVILAGSVETAKAVVNMSGACRIGDSCLFLAMKIAAVTAEVAARIARDTACFRGGDQGHREQVEGKVNMLNRCYDFFVRSNCSPELITAMAVVVEQARAVIAAAAAALAAAVVLAAVAALIAALIALVELIAAAAAAAAAAAEAVLVAAAAATMIALLVRMRPLLTGGDSSET
jgi:hypothetical protein